MDNISEMLTEPYLRALDGLSIALNDKLRSGAQGARRAAGHGASLEFADFRQYAPGDDMRRVDWNSFARFGRLFVKTYVDERQATANIFIDTSASMDFGRRNKGRYAKLLAASLAYVFLKDMDRVRVYACGKAPEPVGATFSSRERFGEAVRALEGIAFGGDGDIAGALASAEGLRLPGGVSYVISDFFTVGDYTAALMGLRRAHQHVVCVHLLAGDEAAPELAGRLRLVDSETGDYRDINTDAAVLERYAARLAEFRGGLRDCCARRGFGYVYANTDTHVLDVMKGIFTGA